MTKGGSSPMEKTTVESMVWMELVPAAGGGGEGGVRVSMVGWGPVDTLTCTYFTWCQAKAIHNSMQLRPCSLLVHVKCIM